MKNITGAFGGTTQGTQGDEDYRLIRALHLSPLNKNDALLCEIANELLFKRHFRTLSIDKAYRDITTFFDPATKTPRRIEPPCSLGILGLEISSPTLRSRLFPPLFVNVQTPEQEQKFAEESAIYKAQALGFFQKEVGKSLFICKKTDSWSDDTISTFEWIRRNLQGGEDILEQIHTVSNTLRNMGHSLRDGALLREAVCLEERRAKLSFYMGYTGLKPIVR